MFAVFRFEVNRPASIAEARLLFECCGKICTAESMFVPDPDLDSCVSLARHFGGSQLTAQCTWHGAGKSKTTTRVDAPNATSRDSHKISILAKTSSGRSIGSSLDDGPSASTKVK